MEVVICWHCNDSDSCDCFVCVIDTPHGTAAGRCQACKGRRRADAIRPFLIARGIEPGEQRWWRLEGNKRAQAAPRKVFIGWELYEEHMKGATE